MSTPRTLLAVTVECSHHAWLRPCFLHHLSGSGLRAGAYRRSPLPRNARPNWLRNRLIPEAQLQTAVNANWPARSRRNPAPCWAWPSRQSLADGNGRCVMRIAQFDEHFLERTLPPGGPCRKAWRAAWENASRSGPKNHSRGLHCALPAARQICMDDPANIPEVKPPEDASGDPRCGRSRPRRRTRG